MVQRNRGSTDKRFHGILPDMENITGDQTKDIRVIGDKKKDTTGWEEFYQWMK